MLLQYFRLFFNKESHHGEVVREFYFTLYMYISIYIHEYTLFCATVIYIHTHIRTLIYLNISNPTVAGTLSKDFSPLRKHSRTHVYINLFIFGP
jgi:hypothetical protein